MADEEEPQTKRAYGVRMPFIFKSPDKGASHRVPENRTLAEEGEVMQINVIHCVGSESLIKCKGDTKNTERVFVAGDAVDVICPSVNDFQRWPDREVWIIVTKKRDNGTKKRLWLRSLRLLRDKLRIQHEEKMNLKIIEHGLVRERRGVYPSTRCASVVVDGGFTIWIEEGLFPIINTNRFPLVIPNELGPLSIFNQDTYFNCNTGFIFDPVNNVVMNMSGLNYAKTADQVPEQEPALTGESVSLPFYPMYGNYGCQAGINNMAQTNSLDTADNVDPVNNNIDDASNIYNIRVKEEEEEDDGNDNNEDTNYNVNVNDVVNNDNDNVNDGVNNNDDINND